jgi:anti-sigma B factor antagonist
MSIVVKTREANGVSILDVSGRITLGEGSSALRDAIRERSGKGHQKILINLSDVSYMDSSGMGMLVSGFATVTNQGGQLKLMNVTNRVKDLLLITKLYTVFEVYDDERSALRSFLDIAA